MTSDRLHQIEDLFNDTLDLPANDRDHFLAQRCATDPDLLASVQSLLRAQQSTGRFAGIVDGAIALAAPDALTGQRLGAYEIVRELGHGGMGTVYLARRADQVYDRDVAIKLVNAGWGADFVLRRFRVERQILASLDHPNIARLLDGGATPDGRPYLVMEFVDGPPLLDYVTQHDLDLRARIELFCTICDAVQYAHQRLIVHRDLKPSNIMVAGDGTPKLLDFGLAKLHEATGADNATPRASQAHGWRMFTPGYASPEQFNGETITTATDIYSLGATLYELLTGTLPLDVKNQTTSEAERIVAHDEPPRPSSRQPQLRGRLARDLDIIILKSLRKNPSERYQSAAEFVRDLRSALAGTAVVARNYTVVERTQRHLTKYRLAYGAASLIAASLLTGTTLALRSATHAEAARQEAEVHRARATESAQLASAQRLRAEASERQSEARRIDAEAQRNRAQSALALAETRLDDEQRLSSEVLLGLNQSLQGLPGTTAARSDAVKASVAYLDRLVTASSGRDDLQKDLALAYRRMAELTGNPDHANRGDLTGALTIYDKCLSILSKLLTRHAADRDLRRRFAGASLERSTVLTYVGRVQEGLDNGIRAVLEFERLAQEKPSDVVALADLANAYNLLLNGLDRYPNPRLLIPYLAASHQSSERLIASNPSSFDYRGILAETFSHDATMQRFLGDVAAARVSSEAAVRIHEELRALRPNDRHILESLMFGYARVGDIARDQEQAGGALDHAYVEAYAKVSQIAASLAKLDPANTRAQYDYGVSCYRVAEALLARDEHAQAIAEYRKGLVIFDQLARSDVENRPNRIYQAISHSRIGEQLAVLQRQSEANQSYRLAAQLAEPLMAADPPGSAAAVFVLSKGALALDLARHNDRAAENSVREGTAAASRYAAQFPNQPPAAQLVAASTAIAGAVYEALADKSGANSDHQIAKSLFEQAVTAWDKIPKEARTRTSRRLQDTIDHARTALSL